MRLLANTTRDAVSLRTLFLNTVMGGTSTDLGHGIEVCIEIKKGGTSPLAPMGVQISFGKSFDLALSHEEAAWFVAHLGDALIQNGGMRGPLRTTPQGMPCDECGEFTPYTERKGANCGIATPKGGIDVSGHCAACVTKKRTEAHED